MAKDLTDLEAAALARKDRRTIQRWCQSGKLPDAYKAGRSWRIPRRALREAGLPSETGGEDYVRELRVAIGVVEEIAAELDELKEVQFRAEPRVRRNWVRTARELERLEQVLEGLPAEAAKVPERLRKQSEGGRAVGGRRPALGDRSGDSGTQGM